MNTRTCTVVPCDDYDPASVRATLQQAIERINGFSWLHSGMTVAIKANLVIRKKPGAAATTHPVMLAELTRLLREAGARVIVGDSPGGIFTPAYLKSVYRECGLQAVTDAGGELNYDCSQREIDFPQGITAKHFTYTTWLEKADAVITFAKLKTHGLMGISGAVKNQFGVVPGTIKPEYHFLYPKTEDFSNMLIDLNEYVRPCAAFIDGVWGMEGNGPTAGTPRHVGALIASNDIYQADLCLASLIGCAWDQVPTIQSAVNRGLSDRQITDPLLLSEITPLQVPDYHRIPTRGNSWGQGEGIWKLIGPILRRRPLLQDPSQCVSCGECEKVCPAGAVQLQGKPKFDYDKCIRCFCCQEFCPRGALSVHRSFIARLLNQ